MKLKSIAVLLALASGGCAQHPSVTVGVGAGSIALVTCEVNQLSFWANNDSLHTQGSCGILTAAVVLALGGLAAIVTHYADTSAHELGPDEEITTEGTVRLHTHTAPPPVPLDAGIVDSASIDAAVVDAPVD